MRHRSAEDTLPGWPPLVVTSGTLEALKWLGLILMVGDHINARLFNGTIPVLFELGRLALPLFVVVLAYNLARPEARRNGIYGRMLRRLAVFGTLASLPYMALGGLKFGWYPLNVLFTLVVIVSVTRLLDSDQFIARVAAGIVFIIGGGLVEFWWPAVLLGVATWSYVKRSAPASALLALLGCAALGFVNDNQWAMLAVPLIALATKVDVPMPRWARLFYWFYPLHLAVLSGIRVPMRQAGYLFLT